MFFPQLRASLKFFWHYLTPLLVRLLPLLPLLALANYRYFVLLDAEAEKAARDPLTLLLQMLCGLAACAVAIVYTSTVLQGGDSSVRALWRRALPRLPALFLVQILAGLAIVLGLFALILPGLYLMGVLLPAYVLVVQEGLAPLAALRAAWQRFRARPWELTASFCFLLSGLLIVLSGLAALEGLLATAALPLRMAAATGLDLIGQLFSQLIAILLVHAWLAAGTDTQEEEKGGGSA